MSQWQLFFASVKLTLEGRNRRKQLEEKWARPHYYPHTHPSTLSSSLLAGSLHSHWVVIRKGSGCSVIMGCTRFSPGTPGFFQVGALMLQALWRCDFLLPPPSCHSQGSDEAYFLFRPSPLYSQPSSTHSLWVGVLQCPPWSGVRHLHSLLPDAFPLETSPDP